MKLKKIFVVTWIVRGKRGGSVPDWTTEGHWTPCDCPARDKLRLGGKVYWGPKIRHELPNFERV